METVELKRSERFLKTFDVEALDDADSNRALQLILKYRLSTGLGLPDFLIAAQAINREAVLYTFNLKHFASIAELDARPPYERT